MCSSQGENAEIAWPPTRAVETESGSECFKTQGLYTVRKLETKINASKFKIHSFL